MPAIASLMAEDFNELWWNSSNYEEERKECSAYIIGKSSALKYSISKYINELSSPDVFLNEAYNDEIELLKDLSVDGIITTNWDLFLEYLFPDYEIYVGQEELIFSSQQSIAEIYKIHGCCSNSNSLVLTAEDYEKFESKNTYLAAKLITMFVEHPIIFIGYSLTDSTIGNLLKSIVKCLGSDDIDKIRNNLIFVQRPKPDRTNGVSDSYLTYDDTQIPIKLVVTESLVPVYESINSVKRKIPPKILRYCKEQFFELIRDNDPNGKLSVVNYEDLDDKDDIEFYVGVGVVSNEVTELGYAPLTKNDLFLHYLTGKGDYDPQKLVELSLPTLCGRSKYYPAYKYLREIGINSFEEYKVSNLKINKLLVKNIADFQTMTFKNTYIKNAEGKTLEEIVSQIEPHMVCYIVPFMPLELMDVSILENFIMSNQYLLDAYEWDLYYRKLICLFDYLKYGFASD